MKKTITANDIMTQTQAFYPRLRVDNLWAGRAALTAREINRTQDPPLDRLWMIAKCLLNERTNRLLACDIAARRLSWLRIRYKSVEAIRRARLYIAGEAKLGS